MPEDIRHLAPQVLETLRARAQRLAAPPGSRSEISSGAVAGHLVARLYRERIGLNVANVSQVVPVGSVIQLPGVPDHLVGLTRVRGVVTALVDLRRFWYGSSAGHVDSDTAVIVAVGGLEFGIVCAEVEGLLDVRAGSQSPCPPHLSGELRASLSGFLGEDLMLVDLGALVAISGFVPSRTKGEAPR